MPLSKCPFSLWAAFPLICLGTGLAAWLTFSLEFDRRASPGWQFFPYLTMLACALLASVALACQPVFSWLGRFRPLLPLLPVVALAVFAGLAWFEGGPYLSVKDDRISLVVLKSASLSGVMVACLALARASLMLCRFMSETSGFNFRFCCPRFPGGIRRLGGSSGFGDSSGRQHHEEKPQEQERDGDCSQE